MYPPSYQPVYAPPIEQVQPLNSAAVQWESYNFPVIKWKAHAVPKIADAIGQLSTTFVPSQGRYGLLHGTVKYKLTLYKVPEVRHLSIELVDRDGFSITKALFSASAFHHVPNSENLIEAAGESQCSEADYRRITDYSINDSL